MVRELVEVVGFADVFASNMYNLTETKLSSGK
jgi:hypothetical protein